jgi:hypothetical protein
VDTIQEALELLTGVQAGHRQASGDYPAETLLARAMERAHEFWRRSLQSPPENDVEEDGEADAEAATNEGAEGAADKERAAARPRRRYQR